MAAKQHKTINATALLSKTRRENIEARMAGAKALRRGKLVWSHQKPAEQESDLIQKGAISTAHYEHMVGQLPHCACLGHMRPYSTWDPNASHMEALFQINNTSVIN